MSDQTDGYDVDPDDPESGTDDRVAERLVHARMLLLPIAMLWCDAHPIVGMDEHGEPVRQCIVDERMAYTAAGAMWGAQEMVAGTHTDCTDSCRDAHVEVALLRRSITAHVHGVCDYVASPGRRPSGVHVLIDVLSDDLPSYLPPVAARIAARADGLCAYWRPIGAPLVRMQLDPEPDVLPPPW